MASGYRRAAGFGGLAVGVLLAASVAAEPRTQPPDGKREPPLPPPPTIFDLSYEVDDPGELLREGAWQNRWRRIWKAFGMRTHFYPAQLSGPENWPPHLFAGGMNYSIWRNPVTGWNESSFP